MSHGSVGFDRSGQLVPLTLGLHSLPLPAPSSQPGGAEGGQTLRLAGRAVPCGVCGGGFGGADPSLGKLPPATVTAAKLAWLPGPSSPALLTRALLHLLRHGKQAFVWLSDGGWGRTDGCH